MAPEQLTPGAPLSERTDLYALGLVLYELLVGRQPFSAESAALEPPPRPSTLVPDVDPPLERVILQALAPRSRAIVRRRRPRWPRACWSTRAGRTQPRPPTTWLAGGAVAARGRRPRRRCGVAWLPARRARSDRPGHDRPGRLHEHDRRAGVRRHAQSRAGRRAGTIAVPQGVSRRSRARDAASDAARTRRARHAIDRARDCATRTAEGAGRPARLAASAATTCSRSRRSTRRPATSWRASRSRPPARSRC